MGANFVTVSFEACSEAQMKEKFLDYQEEKRYEDGSDSYSGHMGLAHGLYNAHKVFKNNQEAESWLEDNVEKGESAVAVQVGDFSKSFPQTVSDKKLVQNYEAIDKEVKSWNTNIVARVCAGKSLQKGCEHCGSKIAVKYIKQMTCPVCNHDFLSTATDEIKFKALNVKLKTLKTNLDMAKKKYNEDKTMKPHWLIGALCRS